MMVTSNCVNATCYHFHGALRTVDLIMDIFMVNIFPSVPSIFDAVSEAARDLGVALANQMRGSGRLG